MRFEIVMDRVDLIAEGFDFGKDRKKARIIIGEVEWVYFLNETENNGRYCLYTIKHTKNDS